MKLISIHIISILFSLLNAYPSDLELLTVSDNFFIFLNERNDIKIYDHLGKLNSTIHIPIALRKEHSINILLTHKSTRETVFILQKDGDHKLVSIGGGGVYESVNDTLAKIDNSFNHRMTHSSAVFSHNDTIFKFGGYGYWNSRNFITYFDKKTKEWEYFNTKTILTPPGVAQINYSLIDNDFYFLQGYTTITADKPIKVPNKEMWKFSFKDRKWVNFGLTKLPLYDTSVKIDDNNFLAKTIDGSYIKVDFKENKYNFFDSSQTSFNFNYNNSVIVNDTLYQLSKNNVIIKSPFDEIFFASNAVDSTDKSIYLRSLQLFNKLGLTTFFLFGLIIFSLIFLKYRRNQRPRIDELGLRYKGVNYKLNEFETQMIICVLNQKEVPSQLFFDIVENSKLSYPQNNKIKNDTIKKLNDKLEKILNIKDFIQSKKLEEDGRVLVYFSNHKEIFINN